MVWWLNAVVIGVLGGFAPAAAVASSLGFVDLDT
jgi:hypothetical protein